MIYRLYIGGNMVDYSPQNLLFGLAVFLILLHYIIIFLSKKYHISDKSIQWSQELVKYVVAAWIGSIIGKG